MTDWNVLGASNSRPAIERQHVSSVTRTKRLRKGWRRGCQCGNEGSQDQSGFVGHDSSPDLRHEHGPEARSLNAGDGWSWPFCAGAVLRKFAEIARKIRLPAMQLTRIDTPLAIAAAAIYFCFVLTLASAEQGLSFEQLSPITPTAWISISIPGRAKLVTVISALPG